MTYKPAKKTYNITSNYTVNSDGTYLVNPDNEGSDVTLTLPPSGSGKIRENILVKNIGQGVDTGCGIEYFNVTIITQGTDKIDRQTEIQLSNNNSVIVVDAGDGNYFTLG